MRELDSDKVLDAFGGTGIFSYLCKQLGKQVVYNDVLKFNAVIGRAIIENDDVRLSKDDVTRFTTLAANEGDGRFVETVFDGIYFTKEENRWIDSALLIIKKLKKRNNAEPYTTDLLYYCLIQSCLCKRPFNLFHRKNLQLRLAKVNRTFGNKTTWDRPFGETFAKFADEVNHLVVTGKKSCTATNKDILEYERTDFDLVYIDPPYLLRSGTNETSNYLQNYHFLEGLVRAEEWPKLIDYRSLNKRFVEDNQSPWIDRNKNSHAFDLLFEKFRKSTLLISHKEQSIPSLSTMVRKLKRLGKKVRYISQQYSYALSRQNSSKQYNREFLIIAE